jgi:hypothetical protein
MDRADRPAMVPAGWSDLPTLRVERRPDGTEVRHLEGGYRWYLSLDDSQLLVAETPAASEASHFWSDAAKQRAHDAVRRQVASGAWPAARDVRCADCGGWARIYHHARGYDPAHHLDVVPLCGRCHTRGHDAGRDG